MISTKELEAMRSILANTFPDTCSILTVTRTADGEGGFTESWGTTTSGVACRLDMQSGSESMNADALTPYTRWVLSVASSESITTNNRILIGSTTYNVLSVNSGASWKLVTRAILEKV